MKYRVIMPPVSVVRYVTCSWRHETVNPVIDRYCPSCGHRAMARVYCDCPKCRNEKVP